MQYHASVTVLKFECIVDWQHLTWQKPQNWYVNIQLMAVSPYARSGTNWDQASDAQVSGLKCLFLESSSPWLAFCYLRMFPTFQNCVTMISSYFLDWQSHVYL